MYCIYIQYLALNVTKICITFCRETDQAYTKLQLRKHGVVALFSFKRASKLWGRRFDDSYYITMLRGDSESSKKAFRFCVGLCPCYRLSWLLFSDDSSDCLFIAEKLSYHSLWLPYQIINTTNCKAVAHVHVMKLIQTNFYLSVRTKGTESRWCHNTSLQN